MYKIRPMEYADLRAVSEIEKDTFSVPWSLASFKSVMESKSKKYYVVLDDEIVVAYTGIWIIADEADITNVAVRSDYRGKGIGTMLLKTITDYCDENGIYNMTLEVREGNEAAIALYKKFEFESAGIRKDFYDKPKENALIMWRRKNCE